MTDDSRHNSHSKTIEVIRQRIDKITDKLGLPVDPGIKEIVVAIQTQGLETSGSCEGHFRDGILSIPWVAIETPGPEGWRGDETLQASWKKRNLLQSAKIDALLDVFNQGRESLFRLKLRDRGIFGAVRLEPAADRETLKPQDLEGYRNEIDAFAQYLLSTPRN